MLVGRDSGKKDGEGCFVGLKRELGSGVAVLRPSSQAAPMLYWVADKDHGRWGLSSKEDDEQRVNGQVAGANVIDWVDTRRM